MNEVLVVRVADALSEYSGMKHDGFWTRVADLDEESRAEALEEARFVVAAIGVGGAA